MDIAFINYGLAFIEGFALILSPCILPILPIILAGALTGGTRRTVGIIAGFTLAFAAFTLFSRFLVESFAINLDLVRQLAFGLIILFGIVLYSDYLSERFTVLTSRMANFGAQYQGEKSDSLFSGILLGIFTSLVWVPCGGPILAAAIIQTAVQTTTAQSFFTFFFFALGSVVPMVIIAFTGNKMINKLGFLKTHLHLLRKFFAVIIIVAASFAAFYGPSAAYSPMPNAPNVVVLNNPADAISSNKLLNALSRPYLAPAIDSHATWFNSPPLTLSELKGKVVLIDFWTYSCINCVRTLPYLKAWDDKYRKEGLVIIGVHTPEFQFEKNPDNVQKATLQYGLKYPVVMDSNYITWTNYHNEYWPADYLIDKNGSVVYAHFGEGDYAEAENNIRVLLGLNEMPTASTQETLPATAQQTPETYLGYARAENFYNDQTLANNQIATYQFPTTLPQDAWSLQGKWTIQAEKIISAEDNAAIKIHFFSGKVYAVMGSPDSKPIKVQVLLNGSPISDHAGKDVHNGVVELSQHALYEIVSLKQPTDGVVELIPANAGAEFYTFTFGD